MPPYRLTPLALQDLKEIARYTSATWGKKQALRYGELLERCFNEIADKTAIVRTFSSLYPQVFVTRCQHHYVFFLHSDGQPPCIIAVLHERMDFVAWLDMRV